MSEFVVGQWVECVDDEDRFKQGHGLKNGEVYRVKELRETDGIYIDEFSQWLYSRRFRPVSWQVGKTYKTTLEGVTATIARTEDECVYGRDSRPEYDYSTWEFHAKTGRLVAYEDSTRLPHLTPYLSDEPSSAAEATESSKSQAIRDEAHEALEAFWRKKASEQQSDPINPPHYQQHPSGVECIQVTEHFGFNVGNAIKYLWRAGLKGDALTDLRKAAWYVAREIQRQEKMKGGAS